MLTFLAFWFLSSASHADIQSSEVLVGGLTYHLIAASDQFQYKLSDDGRLIANGLAGYRRVWTEHVEGGEAYEAMTVFGGYNSIAQPMGGLAWSTGLVDQGTRIGFLFGGYVQDNRKFTERGIGIIFPDSAFGLMPLVGIEVTNKLPHGLLINTELTPLLINLSIGFCF